MWQIWQNCRILWHPILYIVFLTEFMYQCNGRIMLYSTKYTLNPEKEHLHYSANSSHSLLWTSQFFYKNNYIFLSFCHLFVKKMSFRVQTNLPKVGMTYLYFIKPKELYLLFRGLRHIRSTLLKPRFKNTLSI